MRLTVRWVRATSWIFAASLPIAAVADEISVTQWGSSLTGLPYVVALHEGLFQKAGIDVTGIIGSGGGGTTVRNLLASPLPYGEVAVDAALAAKQQGLEIIIVNSGTRQLPGSSIVTKPGSGIRSLHDLIGKKVAITSPRGVSEMTLLMGLQKEHIDPATVTRITSGGYGQGLTMLEHGAVDAAALIEPLSIMQGDRYPTVVRLMQLLPPMVVTVGITTPVFARAHPEQIRNIIAARRAAVRAIYADPQAAAAMLATSGSYRIPPAAAAATIQHMVAAHTLSEGEFNQAEFDRIEAGLRLVGEINAPVDWRALLDPSYLPPDLQHGQ